MNAPKRPVGTLTHDIDLTKKGKQTFKVSLSWSAASGEHGNFSLPVHYYNNGEGPTLLLSGGVHGDEFEGPATLTELVHNGVLDSCIGKLIVIPVLNPPALSAGQRRSPIDGQDLNRSFPGISGGSPTDCIAYLVSTEIIPHCDAVFDLHAGGEVEFIAPSIMTLFNDDTDTFEATLDALDASGLPVVLVTEEFDDHGMLDAEAIRQGKIFGCAELGSAGTLTPASCGWTRSAVFNLLRHFEMLDTNFTPISWKNKYDRTFISLTEMEQTIASPGNGIFRPQKIVGESVLSGEKIGTLLKLFDAEPSVEPIFSDRVGYIYTIASGRPVKPGDMLAVIAEEQTGRVLKSPKANFVSETGS